MDRKNKTPSKNFSIKGRSPKLNNLVRGGKKWSLEKKISGHHITHYDGPKGYNVDHQSFYEAFNISN